MTGQEIIATVLRASSHTFVGRLGNDPEIKFLHSGSCVAAGSLAINKPGAKRDDGQAPDWFRLELWGEEAQAFADRARKGNRVQVTGRVKTNRWTTKQGEQRCDLVVMVDSWRLLEQPAAHAAPAPAPAAAPAAEAPTQHPAYAAAGWAPPAQAAAPAAPAAAPVWQAPAQSNAPAEDDIPF